MEHTVHDLRNTFYFLTENFNPSCFIEAGCHSAFASKYIKQRLPECKVFAYEADPVNFIQFNVELKTLGINHVWKAVSEKEGTTTFYIQHPKPKNALAWQNNSVTQRTISPSAYVEFPVSSNCLDNMHSTDETYCMWVDLEGHAYEALQGATSILAKTKYILLEVEQEQHWVGQKVDTEVLEFLADLGFKVIGKDQEYVSQYNVLLENILDIEK